MFKQKIAIIDGDEKIAFSIVIYLLLIFSVFCGFTEQDDKKSDEDDGEIIEYDSNTINSRFGFMHLDDFQDITDFRLSHSDWHRGESIITTIYQIYESSIPYDEDF